MWAAVVWFDGAAVARLRRRQASNTDRGTTEDPATSIGSRSARPHRASSSIRSARAGASESRNDAARTPGNDDMNVASSECSVYTEPRRPIGSGRSISPPSVSGGTSSTAPSRTTTAGMVSSSRIVSIA